MSIRRLILVAVVLLTAGAVGSALAGWTDLAIGLVALDALAMFAWVVLWAKALNRAVESAGRGSLGPVMNRLDQQDAALHRMSRDVYGVLVTVQRTPSVTKELDRIYRRVVDHDRPMPELGDWAMTPSTLIWIVDQITAGEVSNILECGSGSSTVWFAAALKRRGVPGRVVSLESSADYAEETRQRLVELGLSDRADVIHAPLVSTSIAGRADQPWFDLADLPDDVQNIDLLFVDGPVGGIAHEARYPGFPLLADRLGPDAVVVLDDTGRPDEKAIIKQWSAESHAGRSLAVVRRLDRSTVFDVN